MDDDGLWNQETSIDTLKEYIRITENPNDDERFAEKQKINSLIWYEDMQADLHIELGHKYQKAKSFELAAKEFLKAYELVPYNSGQTYEAGACFFQLGKYKEAISAFEKDIEVEHSDSTHCYMQIAESYLMLEEPEKALLSYLEGLSECDDPIEDAAEIHDTILDLLEKNTFTAEETHQNNLTEIISSIFYTPNKDNISEFTKSYFSFISNYNKHGFHAKAQEHQAKLELIVQSVTEETKPCETSLPVTTRLAADSTEVDVIGAAGTPGPGAQSAEEWTVE